MVELRADLRRRATAACLLLVAAFSLAACSEAESDEGFTVDNREGFLAACTSPLDDSRLTIGVCECVIDEIVTEGRLTPERFEQIELRLTEDPEAELPADVVAIMADCIIDEADL